GHRCLTSGRAFRQAVRAERVCGTPPYRGLRRPQSIDLRRRPLGARWTMGGCVGNRIAGDLSAGRFPEPDPEVLYLSAQFRPDRAPRGVVLRTRIRFEDAA